MNQLAILVISSILFLSACAIVGPEYAGSPEAPVEENESFPSAETTQQDKQLIYSDEEPTDRWWRQLQDLALNDLINEALTKNTDLRVAFANVMAARSLLTESRTQLQPTIDANGSIEASRISSTMGGSPDEAQDDNLVTTASLGLNWELDVFGRIQRSIEVAEANIERQEALYNDVKRILIADIAETYIRLRGAQKQRQVIEKNIENQQKTLELTIVMSEEGMVSELDTVRAIAQLRSTESQLPTVISDGVIASNQLALLCGEAPQKLNIDLQKIEPLPELPAFLPVGEPAKLIRRRPDIREAERSLAALTSQIGVVTADLFPTVSFGASFGISANQPGNLTKKGAPNYTIGPGITWNLFNRDATRARIKQAEASVVAQLARYDGVVLKALEEVDSALIKHIEERNRNAALLESTRASREAVELVQIRYNAGAESFLDVLDAERTLLESERQLTSSDIELAQGLIRIYRTLGGGWRSADPDLKPLVTSPTK